MVLRSLKSRQAKYTVGPQEPTWSVSYNLKLNESKSKEIIISLLKTHIPAATHLTRVES